QWNTPAGSPTGYGVYVSVAPYGSGNLVVNDENVSGSATSYTANLQAGEQYRWNMRAKNGTGWGKFLGGLDFIVQGVTDGVTLLAELPASGGTLSPGSDLQKTLRVQNSGSTTWNTYRLAFIGAPTNGHISSNLLSSGANGMPVGTTVPGQSAD